MSKHAPTDAAEEFEPPASVARAMQVLVLAALWVALTLAIIEPVQAALPNWDELSIDPATLFARLGWVALSGFVSLVPVALFVAWLAPRRAPAISTALCIALFVQGDLFVWEYGTFDGSPLDWSAHAAKGWLEVAVWLGLPVLAAWQAERVTRRARTILALLVLLQLAGLAGIAQHNAPYESKLRPAAAAPAPTGEFARFSSERNAIVVVLDALQSDVFAAAMQAPELAAQMPEGFVYYRNAISLYLSTKFSLQSILTSRPVPSQVDALNWRAWAMQHSLPPVLARKGFDSRLATFTPHALACDRSIPNLLCTPLSQFGLPDAGQVFEADWRAEVSLLLRLAVFRLVPHVVKPQIYDAGDWFVPEAYPRREAGRVDPKLPAVTRADLEALAYLRTNVRVDDGAPRFRFLHLNSVHFPGRAGADCQAVAQPRLRLRQVETAQCVLGELFRFFHALDAAGGYEPSLIVVVADHGSHQLKGIDMRVAQPPLPPDEIGRRGALQNWWRAVPLFLVKQPGARGALSTSDHPVSLCDVPATVLEAMGVEAPAGVECESVGTPTRRRPRLHYSYHETEKQKRLPRSQRYRFNFRPIRVDAHSWYPASWRYCKDGCRDDAGGPATPE